MTQVLADPLQNHGRQLDLSDEGARKARAEHDAVETLENELARTIALAFEGCGQAWWTDAGQHIAAVVLAVERILSARLAAERERIAEALEARMTDSVGNRDARYSAWHAAARIARNGGGR